MAATGPTVSVLIPCYNKRACVEQTLQSVYDQSLQDWELIVVDDGSTDGSTELLRTHEPRARIFYGDNRGASAARQQAFEVCTGRYVQYLDADDLLLPDALERRVAALDASGADVAYADWQRLVPDPAGGHVRGAIEARRITDVHRAADIACATDFWAPPAALLYRRALLETLPPWNEALPIIQDARYLQEAAIAGAVFEHVPGVSALYRDDPHNSLSRRSRLDFIRDVALNATQLEARLRERGRLDAERRRALGDVHGYVARSAFRLDPELFDRCIDNLRTLDALRATGWPSIAARLRAALGTRGALAVLSMLGRPAP